MRIMAFNTIIVYIMVIHVDLFHNIGFPRGVERVAQTTEFPPGWFFNPDAVGISGVIKARAVASLAG